MTTLVLHFNAFNGKLMGGYIANSEKKRSGPPMTANDVLAYMAKNPDAKCEPMKV